MAQAGKTYRRITYRILPGSGTKARKLARLAGVWRKMWNEGLAITLQRKQEARERGENGPSTTFFSTGSEYMRILKKKYPWLKHYQYATVRYVFKYQTDAWGRYDKGLSEPPRFHSRDRTKPSFTIPDKTGYTLRGNQLTIKGKWMCTVTLRRKGGNPYPEGITKDITVYRKGGKWWAAITYEIDDPVIEDTGVVAGIDRNASGMIAVAYSDGRDSEVLESEADKRVRFRKRRYERKLAKQIARQKADGRKGMSNRAKKTQGKIQKCSTYLANFSHNRNHQNSAKIAKAAPVVVVENLKVKSMTASARGTAENPGKNVTAKAGMNRVLLEGAPGQLVQMLGYKCVLVLSVVAAYTSQDCSRCGHRDAGNRASLRKFRCMSCGHAEHADINAAANILAAGVGATGRARGEPLGSLMTRQRNWDQDK